LCVGSKSFTIIFKRFYWQRLPTNMNGIIQVIPSRRTSRHSLTSRQIVTSVAAGVCLFSGFVAGVNVSPQIVQSIIHLNPLHPETLDYSKITWLQSVEVKTMTAQNAEITPVNVEFTPYVLDTTATKKSYAPKPMSAKKRAAMFRELQLAYNRFQSAVKSPARARENIFYDFQTAAKKLRQDFIAATEVTAKPEVMIASNTSAPASDSVRVTAPNVPAIIREEVVSAPVAAPQEKESLSLVRSSAVSLGSMKRWKPAPRKPEEPVVHAAAVVATQAKKKSEAKVAAPELAQAEVTEVTYPEATPKPIPIKNLDSQQVDIQNAAVQNEPVQVKQTFSSSESASDLSQGEKQKLAESLLAVQFENKKIAAIQAAAPAAAIAKERETARQNIPEQLPPDTTDAQKEADFVRDANELHALAANKQTSGCSLLVGHVFIKPDPQKQDGVDTQICPEHKTWISKNWNEKGWVKVDGSEHLSTLTMQPAANGGSTLLLDQNALALIAVKTGTRIASGAGVIVGLVPTGYKVEFAGRGEETQYFELNQKRYFAVINAEPGAGVIELISEHDQNLGSTVFTPVLEDTVTYLDLVAPQARNIGVQVVKSGNANDPEVVGLTVGISTQGNIQAITQSNGRTILKNVNLVSGYPVFIDVSSKSENGEASYTYRYQVKQKNKQGYYVVNQISERSLYKWLKQVKSGLSDQSAMVVGFYNRKILDGFRNNYTTRTEPKSARFGLDPVNYTILWDGKISKTEPLEGDLPRFMSVQVPEGLSQVQLINEANQIANAQLIPVSPRVIHVVSE
jgi:hypothetical protein